MLDSKVVARAEVRGAAIRSIVEAFGNFTVLASQYLLAAGIGETQADGTVRIEDDRFYPMQGWMNVLHRVQRELGARLMRQTGEILMKHTRMPPGVHDIRSALASQNGAYHLAHRLDGKTMAPNPAGPFVDGIGDFLVRFTEHQNLAFVTADTPAPCALNEGSILGLARQFEPDVQLAHEPGECRANGGKKCVYRVTWPAG